MNSSWNDFFGPVQHHGSNFTNSRRYNFSSPNDGLGEPVYGFQNDTKPQPQTFESSNIVILTDGFCGSTCAIFSELMKTQGDVQSIAVGTQARSHGTAPVTNLLQVVESSTAQCRVSAARKDPMTSPSPT